MRATIGVTPSTAVCAILSRVVAVLFAIISDAILPDHTPEGALIHEFPPSCRHATLFSAFARWDAAHVLSLAALGWSEEYSHAFFPLYPCLVRGLAFLLMPLCTPFFCVAEIYVLAGMLVSNTAFVAAACFLHALGDRVLRDPQLARAAALIFCAAPASVFFSSAYSEATFAALTFGGGVMLEDGAPWKASVLLALAAACRANGTANLLLLMHHGARHLVRGYAPSHGTRSVSAASAAAGLLATAVQLAIVSAPYIGWQAVGYWRVCNDVGDMALAAERVPSPTRLAQTSTSTLPAGWCERTWPDLYTHVQHSYWGVGLLRYYEIRQLPNFALAAPALALCAGGTAASSALLRARYGGMPWRDSARHVLGWRNAETKAASGDGAMTPRALPYVAQWALLSAVALLFANVQVVTRLVGAASPPVYWYLAHLLLRRGDGGHGGGASWLRSERLRVCAIGYVGVFVVVGTALHSNALPWT